MQLNIAKRTSDTWSLHFAVQQSHIIYILIYRADCKRSEG